MPQGCFFFFSSLKMLSTVICQLMLNLSDLNKTLLLLLESIQVNRRDHIYKKATEQTVVALIQAALRKFMPIKA